MQEQIARYQQLINKVLPATYHYPIRFNHCFARIVLDWLFQDCWYQHLSRKQPAYSQLTESQLKRAIERMQLWMQNQAVLVADNEASLRYRNQTPRT